VQIYKGKQFTVQKERCTGSFCKQLYEQ